MKPTFLLVLHGHLPFVHHPEYPHFLEEDWLFEAVFDCYLPLLEVLDGWARDDIGGRFTLGLSPPLLSMLALDGLRDRIVRYGQARLRLVERALGDSARTAPATRPALEQVRQNTARHLARFDAAERDVARAFARHADQGRLELMTCGATHGLFPVLLDEGSIEAQVQEAVRCHTEAIGRPPRGLWLPECGVTPLAFGPLARAGIQFTFVEDRAVRLAEPPPVFDVHRPIFTGEGVACFPRDPVAAKEVWSADEGYPGDSRYREFYRDLGYDADASWLDDGLRLGTGGRKSCGVKLHRITGKVPLDEKLPYDPARAAEAVAEHAAHFVEQRRRQAAQIVEDTGAPPCLTATFDAELFGHWWSEGPSFIDQVMRALWAQRDAPYMPVPLTASAYLNQAPTHQLARPAVSSWGDGGAFRVWVNQKNDWLWRKIYDARARLGQILRACDDAALHEALAQAAREVMLAQSSDWPFIITMDREAGYARRRPLVHLARAHRLMDGIEAGAVDAEDLAQICARDRIFLNIDTAPFSR